MATAPSLDARLQALAQVAELGRDREPDALIERADAVIAHAGERRALAAAHTVVGFFGATGSGKSSLFNAVTGTSLARVAVRRPTTSEPLAAVWDRAGAEPLLDWLGVQDRHWPDAPFGGVPDLSLILLDLPDFDSIRSAHRDTVERLAAQVDVFIWVVDPQKYADVVLHRDFIAPLAQHAAVTAAVLNQADRVPDDELDGVLDSLRGLLRADGLTSVRVLPASAVTGDGVEALRGVITTFARERRAADARLGADVVQIAQRLQQGEHAPTASIPKSAERDLARGLAHAAGIDLIARAVAASYRSRAGKATGWPLTSWTLGLRPDPLRRLHLRTDAPAKAGRDPELHRSSLPPMSAAALAQSGRAVRAYADTASAALPDGWRARVRRRAAVLGEALPDALDGALARTDLGARRGWWWPIVTVVQWLSIVLMAVSGLWLLAGWLLPLWNLPAPNVPLLKDWPIVDGRPVFADVGWLGEWAAPIAGLVAGALLGIVVGLLAALVSAWIAVSIGRRARRRLAASIRAAAAEQVVRPLSDELDRYTRFRTALTVAAAPTR